MKDKKLKVFLKRRRKLIRSALWKRDTASQSILIILVFYTVTIFITRFFLRFTGWPQLEIFDLHIRHNLWGVLFLTIGGILSLYFKGDFIIPIISGIVGMGLGLFMDEIGEFVTVDINYFWSWSYTLMYFVFLLLVGLYFASKKDLADEEKDLLIADLARTRDYYLGLTKDEVDQVKENTEKMIKQIKKSLIKLSFEEKKDLKIELLYLQKHLEFLREAEKIQIPDDFQFSPSLLVSFPHKVVRSKKFVKLVALISILGGLIKIILATFGLFFFVSGLPTPSRIQKPSQLIIGETFSLYLLSGKIFSGFISLLTGWGLWHFYRWSWYLAVIIIGFGITVGALIDFYYSPDWAALEVAYNGLFLISLLQPNIKAVFLRD